MVLTYQQFDAVASVSFTLKFRWIEVLQTTAENAKIYLVGAGQNYKSYSRLQLL